MQPYVDAYSLKRKLADEEHWMQGYYNHVAFSVVMSHFGASFGGKQSDAEYLDKPLLSDANEPNEESNNDNEVIGAFEMAQRINMLKSLGLPESPK